MKKIKEIRVILKKFNYILSKKQKWSAIWVMFLTLIGAIFETLGVSVIIPFMSVLLDAETLLEEAYIVKFCQLLHLENTEELIIAIGILIGLIYLIKNMYLSYLSFIRARFATRIQKELSVKLMNAYMKRNYSFFTQTNTSELLQGISGDISGVYQMLYNVMKILAEVMTSLAIVLFIIQTDIQLALSIFLLAGACSGVIFISFGKPMARMGVVYRENSEKINRYGLTAFQGIKEILVTGRQKFFVDQFSKAIKMRQKAIIGQTVAAEIPGYMIEAVCVGGLLFAVCLKIYNQDIDMDTFIPQLGAFAAAAFRILPSMGRISSSFNQFIYYGVSLREVYNSFKEVEQQQKGYEDQYMSNGPEDEADSNENPGQYLWIQNVDWSYPQSSQKILDQLNMTIHKGESVALIGQSGAGKTTLADIILGLYKPVRGEVLFEGKSIFHFREKWCKTINYIPQAIYLSDDTIKNNVAFGIPDEQIDDERVWSALERAQLSGFVRGLPGRLDTVIGERGIRFSGGQRQRIAIARALYDDPDVLILDEATSALDNETEMAVMEAIEILQGKITLIIIAHRLTTIRNCDRIYEIMGGKAVERKKEEVCNR